ncbi:hypothetical protein LPMP_203710 [Leishmania panamensis]|uniref:Phosphatidylinositol N-acetylglucosaminyltransferase, putative n=2 Tax=Leishmania guyanensis species complex TaxID=38579 RepID=A0A088RPV1_LEIPA|nr:hypothetical protein LPMP_203710 [Leishmania panamensis]AIN97865.1 hypothetical protein LPMP_203710 [Leishmania panamensis]
MLDIPDYREKPFLRLVYAWPAFVGIILFTLSTFVGMARCVLRSLDSGSPPRIGLNTTTSVRQDIFNVIAAPLIFQGLCVSVYTTWMSWKFFRHN